MRAQPCAGSVGVPARPAKAMPAPVIGRKEPRVDSPCIFWGEREIPYQDGDTAALALARAGVHDLGTGPSGLRHGLFCGIGQCQGCLVLDAVLGVTEACLLPCRPGLRLQPCRTGPCSDR